MRGAAGINAAASTPSRTVSRTASRKTATPCSGSSALRQSTIPKPVDIPLKRKCCSVSSTEQAPITATSSGPRYRPTTPALTSEYSC